MAKVRKTADQPQELVVRPPGPPPTGTDDHLIEVLQNSVYPGASPDSIRLVINYCRLNNLDPLLKPVHIVPMSVEVEVPNPSYREGTASPRFVKVWKKIDTIMPGIGLYRIRAARAGDYMGLSAPQWGDDIEINLSGTIMVVPEWCAITAFKMINGEKVPFHAQEFWLESYATAARNTDAPNSMWKRRPRAQLLKCTKAQALREGWPDVVGAAPTADEMEGKPIYREDIDGEPATVQPIAEPQPKQHPVDAPPPFVETAALPEHKQPVHDVAEVTAQARATTAERQPAKRRTPTPAQREAEREVEREFKHYDKGGKGAWVGEHDQNPELVDDDDEDERVAAEERAAIQNENQPLADEKLASGGAIRSIKSKMERGALSLSDLRKVAGFENLQTLNDLKAYQVNAVLKWTENPTRYEK